MSDTSSESNQFSSNPLGNNNVEEVMIFDEVDPTVLLDEAAMLRDQQEEMEMEEREAEEPEPLIVPPPAIEETPLPEFVAAHSVTVNINGRRVNAWSRQVLVNGPPNPVAVPSVQSALSFAMDVDTVQAMFTFNAFRNVPFSDCTIYGHSNVRPNYLGERSHIKFHRRRIGLYKNIALFKAKIGGLPLGEIWLVKVNPRATFDFGQVRRAFHRALLRSAEEFPTTGLPSTIERWMATGRSEAIQVRGAEVARAWALMEIPEAARNDYRLVYSAIDLKRTDWGNGPILETLATVRQSLPNASTVIVDVGMVATSEVGGTAVYPTQGFVEWVHEMCRRIEVYPLYCSNVCIGLVGTDGPSYVSLKVYDVRTEATVKDAGGSIIDRVCFQPAEAATGPVALVESYLARREGPQTRRIREAKQQARSDVESVLSILADFERQATLTCPARLEVTFDLDIMVTDENVMANMRTIGQVLRDNHVVISSADRSQLAVRAGATILSEALGRGQEGDQPVAMDRASIAYRMLMEALLKAVILSPNYAKRSFRRIIHMLRVEQAAIDVGIPTFAQNTRPDVVDVQAGRVLTTEEALTDGDKDLRTLIGFMRIGEEIVATTLLWALFIIRSHPDDLALCCRAIVIIDLACNYAFLKSRKVLEPGAGIFQEGPYSCYQRQGTPRYTPNAASHNGEVAKDSAIPSNHLTMPLGQYVGHRFGSDWSHGDDALASNIAFHFLMEQIGFERKEDALLALRTAFVDGGVAVGCRAKPNQPIAKVGRGRGSLVIRLVNVGPIRALGETGNAEEGVRRVGYRLGDISPLYRNYRGRLAQRDFELRPVGERNQQVRRTRYDYAVVYDAMRRFRLRGGRISWADFAKDPNNGFIRQQVINGRIVNHVHRSKNGAQNIVSDFRRRPFQRQLAQARIDADSVAFLSCKREFLLGDNNAPLTLAGWDEDGIDQQVIAADAQLHGVDPHPQARFTERGVSRSLLSIPDLATERLPTGWRIQPTISARAVGFSGILPLVHELQGMEEGGALSETLVETLFLLIDASASPTVVNNYALFSPSITTNSSVETRERFASGWVNVEHLGEAVTRSAWRSSRNLVDAAVPLLLPLQVRQRLVLAVVYRLIDAIEGRECNCIMISPLRDLELVRESKTRINRLLLRLASSAGHQLDQAHLRWYQPLCRGSQHPEGDAFHVGAYLRSFSNYQMGWDWLIDYMQSARHADLRDAGNWNALRDWFYYLVGQE